MTGIDKPLKVPLIITKGKSAVYTVQPLKEAPKPTQTTAPVIPQQVISETQRALAEGKRDEYAAYLTEQGAPEHILTYVKAATA